MKKPNLSKYIQGVAAKRIKKVELGKQHEFDGIDDFKRFLGAVKKRFKTEYIYLPDEEEGILRISSMSTWYDSRKHKDHRSSEFRLYYKTNEVIDKAKVDDTVFVCLRNDETLLTIITPRSSTSENQMKWFFDIHELSDQLSIKDFKENDKELDFISKQIIEILGMKVLEDDSDEYEKYLVKFGLSFPSTIEFSTFARQFCKDAPVIDDPDIALMSYLEMEEFLFRVHERNIVQSQIDKIMYEGEKIDVEEFVQFSLSITNRRKSRAGRSFENHLAYIFTKHKLEYSNGTITEGNKKPDFIFPGSQQYHDTSFSTELLTMLGVKTTAKDRWRQVLSEADRIKFKHLITTQPAITENQTEEMKDSNLTLVIPTPIQNSYRSEQLSSILSLDDFIRLVSNKQGGRLIS